MTTRSLRCMSTSPEAEHAAWLKEVTAYPVTEPKFHPTLEFALPTPVPLHQFETSPIVVEVSMRNPEYQDGGH